MAHLVWPLFDLEIRTPRLTLRYVDDECATALAVLATEGVHDPDEMPFTIPWTDLPSPQQEWGSMQHYWQFRSSLSAAAWSLPFAVVVDGEIVGMQGMSATNFGVLREVGTGSWLARRVHGRGIGTEMRQAILHLAFAGLGAVRAHSAANVSNPSSLGVSRKLGYTENGRRWAAPRGEPVEQIELLLSRESWESTLRRDDIEIVGLEPCLDLLGL